MPDCSAANLDRINKKLTDQAMVQLGNIGDLVKNMIGQPIGNLISDLGGGGLGELAGGAITSSLSNMLMASVDDILDNPLFGMQSIAGLMISMMTIGPVAYLGFTVFIMSLLRQELQQRMVISGILMDDLDFLKSLIENLNSAFGADKGKEKDQNLKNAFDHVKSATTLVGEAWDLRNNLNVYDTERIKLADADVETAKYFMNTPILDAIGQVIEDAHIFENSKVDIGGVSFFAEDYAGYFKKPTSVVGSVENILSNDGSWETEWQNKRKSKKADRQKNIDTMMKGLAEYSGLGYNAEVVYNIQGLLKKVGEDLAKYTPLELKRTVALLKATYGAVKYLDENGLPDASFSTLDGLIDGVKPLMENRSLLNMNSFIKDKYENLEKLPEAFRQLSALGEATDKNLRDTFNLLYDLQREMAPYVPHILPGVQDVYQPSKVLKSDAIKSLKLVVWKNKLNVIKKKLARLAPKVATGAGLNDAYASLDLLNANIARINEKYKDDNKYTPDSEGAYLILIDLIGDIGDAIIHPNKLKELDNKAAEASLSLRLSNAQDSIMISSIDNFTKTVWNIPELKDTIALFDKLLLQQGTVGPQAVILKGFIDRIKTGDIGMLINSVASPVNKAWDTTKAIVDTIELPQKGAIGDAFKMAMTNVGSAFSSLGDCMGEFFSSSAAAENQFLTVDEAIELANQSMFMNDEQIKAALAENGEVVNQLNLQKSQLEGIDPMQITTREDEEATRVAVEDGMDALGYQSVDNFINGVA